MGTRGRKSRAELSVVPFRPKLSGRTPTLIRRHRQIILANLRGRYLTRHISRLQTNGRCSDRRFGHALEAAVMSEARDCLMFIVFCRCRFRPCCSVCCGGRRLSIMSAPSGGPRARRRDRDSLYYGGRNADRFQI